MNSDPLAQGAAANVAGSPCGEPESRGPARLDPSPGTATSTWRKWPVPFLCALVASPLFVLLHELAHYAAGACLGFSVNLHYSQVNGTMPEKALGGRGEALQAIAGPLLQAALTVAGFLWLASRRHRRDAPLTSGDWLATILVALNAGHWLRGFLGSPDQPQLVDEARVSEIAGLPRCFLPYLLGSLAVVAILAAMRLHPPGARLAPFLCVGLGGGIGFFLWMKVLGPSLLP